MTEIEVNCKIILCNEEIKKGDLFFFRTSNGIPVIRKAKGEGSGEEWNGFINSHTREKSYFKIKEIQGLILSPKDLLWK